jgi:uncharacterized protein YndB with AHSA1/START domain
MKKTTEPRRVAGIGDAAVQARTGRTWAEWFALLDKAGAGKMDHRSIATYIHDEHGCSGWWSQMVTVGYEQERGLRERHQKPEGYQISASRTINASAAKLFNAWSDESLRTQWLPRTPVTVRKATAGKSLRITWKDGKTSVDVNIYPKDKGKCQITVQHSKLANLATAERMKGFWGKTLDRLRTFVES